MLAKVGTEAARKAGRWGDPRASIFEHALATFAVHDSVAVSDPVVVEAESSNAVVVQIAPEIGGVALDGAAA